MPSLIITAMSVMILAFAIVAGTNFVNPSLHSRIEVSRVLGSQYASISSAIASYKIENQGVSPSSLDDVKGYVAAGAIDGFGHRSKIFSWSVEPGADGQGRLCLSYLSGSESDYGTLMGLHRFVLDIAAQRPGRLTFGATCTGAAAVVAVEGLADYLNESGANLSMRFEDR